HDVEAPVLDQHAQRGVAVLGGLGPVPEMLGGQAGDPPVEGVVVDDEDAGSHGIPPGVARPGRRVTATRTGSGPPGSGTVAAPERVCGVAGRSATSTSAGSGTDAPKGSTSCVQTRSRGAGAVGTSTSARAVSSGRRRAPSRCSVLVPWTPWAV